MCIHVSLASTFVTILTQVIIRLVVLAKHSYTAHGPRDPPEIHLGVSDSHRVDLRESPSGVGLPVWVNPHKYTYGVLDSMSLSLSERVELLRTGAACL